MQVIHKLGVQTSTRLEVKICTGTPIDRLSDVTSSLHLVTCEECLKKIKRNKKYRDKRLAVIKRLKEAKRAARIRG